MMIINLKAFSTFVIAIGIVLTESVNKVALAGYVDVPSNYVYDTSGRSGPVTLHDYCSYSPDEFPSPVGGNVSFQGPCARHDLCYDSRTDKKQCDARLLQDMYENCEDKYGKFNPNRQACKATARGYFAAVVVHH